MKWLFIASVGLAGVIVLVVAIGAFLPRDHVAAMSLRIAASPEAWATLPPSTRTFAHSAHILAGWTHRLSR